ncbi:MAG: hypothetical protein LBI79_06680 [Nitrososphaerota archaeon]|jgi:hypothetical protein|nr:hypothetical protein [Nitrososphaerota archaeon]
MITASSLLFPVIILVIALAIGAGFSFVPIKSKKHKPLPLLAFATTIGAAGLIVIFLFTGTLSSSLNSLGWFQNFINLFENVDISIIKYNATIIAALLIIAAGEIGLGLGFGVASVATNRLLKSKLASPKELDIKTTPEISASTPISATNLANIIITKNREETEDQNLRRDEQSVMELFLYGKVSRIIPKIAPNTPEGYLYDGIPQLDWDTKHSRQVLDALVRKGYLHAELIDKVIVCQTCGSGNVRVIKTCPDCGSLWLQKEALLEHFSCGAMEQENTFKTQSGDLVCPKCKTKLEQGVDCRVLPPGYICLSCSTLNREPRFIIKCNDCTSVADIDDEPEILLYQYSANAQMPLHECQRIKPLGTCVQFFKSLGYTIVAPAFISGRSGIQHLFDILILDKVRWAEPPNVDDKPLSKSNNGNTLVEVLISTQPIEVEELTRIFGKTIDIDCAFILFAIPRLTPNARSYAQTHGIKVIEGQNIEEALSNSKITVSNTE